MKRFLAFLLLLASPAHAVTYLDITNLPDLGTPTQATDSLVTYDSSAAVGDKQTELKFSADVETLLSGGGTWLSFANIKASMDLNLVENTALSTWAGSTNITTLGAVTATSYEGTISPTELGYLNGVTSAIQTQITAITPSAYVQTIIDDADEATFKATTNLEAGTDYNAYSALLADIAGLSLTGGDIMYYDGTNIVKLDNGTANYLLQANGTTVAPSWTGSLSISAIDLGGGVIEITNSADPTVNAAGEIALDTSDDQLTYYGAAQRTLRYEEEVCVTIEDLAAADDDYTFMSWRDAVTITGVWCHYRGTGTTPATITLEDGAGNAMTITDTAATCAASTGAATPKAVTAANTLTAYEMLAFNVSNAVAPETDEYTICVSYTVTEQ